MTIPRPLLFILQHSLALVERANQRLGRSLARTPAHQRGIEGEHAAYFHLRRQGYVVVARRWRSALLDGEVDLIAWEGETLCFIEVKTRGSRTPFAAEFSVDRNKVETLRTMAHAYVAQFPSSSVLIPAVSVRFDVVSVYVRDGVRPDVRLLRDFVR